MAKESSRVLKEEQMVVLNINEMLINGEKFPTVADATRILQDFDTWIEKYGKNRMDTCGPVEEVALFYRILTLCISILIIFWKAS